MTAAAARGEDHGSPGIVGGGAAGRARGGSARVAVWDEPDPDAKTLGGAGVRALVLPQLFVAEPDGTWAAALVEPFSDRTGGDGTSATFKLRDGARWSDGTPITVEDLRRSADARFVAGIDGPSPDGTISVRFSQHLPGWRRLWSGIDSVAAPHAGVWGGPFVEQSRTPGLETVLARNDRWYGGPGPFLDTLHLVVIPDPTTARQLLGRGEIDVVMPPAATVRTAQLRATPDVSVETAPSHGGWWVGLRMSADKLNEQRRRALVATVDRQAFIPVLLRDEAVSLDGFADGDQSPWASVKAGDSGALTGQTVDLVGENEEPMTGLLQRAMQLRARASKGDLELRNAESDRVEGWVASGVYGAAIIQQYDGPAVCWTCRWSNVDSVLATRADAGEVAAATALEGELRDRGLLLPLWRPIPVTAHRTELRGVRANAYGLNGAWDAWAWSR